MPNQPPPAPNSAGMAIYPGTDMIGVEMELLRELMHKAEPNQIITQILSLHQNGRLKELLGNGLAMQRKGKVCVASEECSPHQVRLGDRPRPTMIRIMIHGLKLNNVQYRRRTRQFCRFLGTCNKRHH